MKTVPVLIHLPLDVYQVLAEKADVDGGQVHSMIEAATTKTVRGRRNGRITPAVSEAIWHMSKAGLSDTRIAKKLGISQSTISKHREGLGLAAHSASPNPKAARS